MRRARPSALPQLLDLVRPHAAGVYLKFLCEFRGLPRDEAVLDDPRALRLEVNAAARGGAAASER